MPTRRKTLIGLGILTAGGAGAVATGAFSAATAERTVNTSFANSDTNAILAFQPTSAYADLSGANNEIQLNFEDLNSGANFTFEDTFIILNNGTETVTLEAIGSSDSSSDPRWRNEDSEQPASVLISNSVNEWQGSPNEDFINENQVDASVVNGGNGANVNADYFHAGDLGNNGNTVELGPRGADGSLGDWISIGFEFGQSGSVGGWNPGDIPNTLQFEFGPGDSQ